MIYGCLKTSVECVQLYGPSSPMYWLGEELMWISASSLSSQLLPVTNTSGSTIITVQTTFQSQRWKTHQGPLEANGDWTQHSPTWTDLRATSRRYGDDHIQVRPDLICMFKQWSSTLTILKAKKNISVSKVIILSLIKYLHPGLACAPVGLNYVTQKKLNQDLLGPARGELNFKFPPEEKGEGVKNRWELNLSTARCGRTDWKCVTQPPAGWGGWLKSSCQQAVCNWQPMTGIPMVNVMHGIWVSWVGKPRQALSSL